MADTKTYDELKPVIEDMGEGNIIDAELLEGSWTEVDELPDMDDNQAAMVAGHIFEKLYDAKVDQQACDAYDTDEQEWSGTVEGFNWEISVDGDDFVIDFSFEEGE